MLLIQGNVKFIYYIVLEAPRPMGRSFPPRCAKLTGLAESAGKEDLATQPPPPSGLVGQMGAKWGHVPKAQGLKRRGRDSRPCNREGAKGG